MRSVSSFPPRAPIAALIVLLLSIPLAVGILSVWKYFATAGEAFYLKGYVKSTVLSYVPARHPSPHLFAIDKGRTAMLFPSAFRQSLRTIVYGGRSVGDVLRVPFYVWAGITLLALMLAVVHDVKIRRQLIDKGVQLNGRRKLAPREFNRRTDRDGWQLATDTPCPPSN
jgi:heme exporter protein D